MESSARITKSLRNEDVEKKWWVIDANNMTIGRLATQVATLIRGKHKPAFTPHIDCGDSVIVINASKVVAQGKRAEMKEYFRHSGYPGGVTMSKLKHVMLTNPTFAVEHSVKGMLPKNRLGRKMIKSLYVYGGDTHPHAAQKPESYELKYH